MKMEQTECSEMSAYKIQTPGNHPKESIQHTCFFCIFSSIVIYIGSDDVLLGWTCLQFWSPEELSQCITSGHQCVRSPNVKVFLVLATVNLLLICNDCLVCSWNLCTDVLGIHCMDRVMYTNTEATQYEVLVMAVYEGLQMK